MEGFPEGGPEGVMDTRNRTQVELDRKRRHSGAAMVGYIGWFVLVLSMLVAMLTADDLTVAGAIGAVGLTLILWATPFLLWPEAFDQS